MSEFILEKLVKSQAEQDKLMSGLQQKVADLEAELHKLQQDLAKQRRQSFQSFRRSATPVPER